MALPYIIMSIGQSCIHCRTNSIINHSMLYIIIFFLTIYHYVLGQTDSCWRVYCIVPILYLVIMNSCADVYLWTTCLCCHDFTTVLMCVKNAHIQCQMCGFASMAAMPVCCSAIRSAKHFRKNSAVSFHRFWKNGQGQINVWLRGVFVK